MISPPLPCGPYHPEFYKNASKTHFKSMSKECEIGMSLMFPMSCRASWLKHLSLVAQFAVSVANPKMKTSALIASLLLVASVQGVQLRAPEDELAKEMTHDLEMNFNKIAPCLDRATIAMLIPWSLHIL